MKLSVVIPAYNEAENLPKTIGEIYDELVKENIEHEILVSNDNSEDNTAEVIDKLERKYPTMRHVFNSHPNGYGYAVRRGLENFNGECGGITMADLSDDPKDIVKYYRKMQETGCDMVFGSRWMKGAKVVDYPKKKLWLNRLVNNCIRFMFFFKYNDVTNGFKLFSKEAIDGLKPFISGQFSFALELPLKAIVRGYSYEVVPNNWYNREVGESNLKIGKMMKRYLFVLLNCLNERLFSMGDYKKGVYNAPRLKKK